MGFYNIILASTKDRYAIQAESINMNGPHPCKGEYNSVTEEIGTDTVMDNQNIMLVKGVRHKGLILWFYTGNIQRVETEMN